MSQGYPKICNSGTQEKNMGGCAAMVSEAEAAPEASGAPEVWWRKCFREKREWSIVTNTDSVQIRCEIKLIIEWGHSQLITDPDKSNFNEAARKN